MKIRIHPLNLLNVHSIQNYSVIYVQMRNKVFFDQRKGTFLIVYFHIDTKLKSQTYAIQSHASQP